MLETQIIIACSAEPCLASEDNLACTYINKNVSYEDLSGILSALHKSHEAATLQTHPVEAQAKEANTLAGFRILPVEDNAINIEIATELLKDVGIIVTPAVNGEICLEKIEEAQQAGFHPPFDLVLMDLQMPVLDGYETTRRIRANPKHDDLIIIAMTAHAMEEDREHCLGLGMNEHITKPIDVTKLYTVLRRFLLKTDE